MEIDIHTLKGADLFYYMTEMHPDRKVRSMVFLLSYAIMDSDKMHSTLERMVASGKSLVAIYPGLGEKPTPDMKYLGSIPDGALYLSA